MTNLQCHNGRNVLNESRNAENHVSGGTILFDCTIDLLRERCNELLNPSMQVRIRYLESEPEVVGIRDRRLWYEFPEYGASV